jgi:hypothetical protein
MYSNLICILYALLCGQNFLLVKSGCYILECLMHGTHKGRKSILKTVKHGDIAPEVESTI